MTNEESIVHSTYNVFGSLTASSGEYAGENPFRFSSEYSDVETGLVYYNYRYYSPGLGRWLSRDPIEEQGGYNLYGMLGNGIANYWDKQGLFNLGIGSGGVPGTLPFSGGDPLADYHYNKDQRSYDGLCSQCKEAVNSQHRKAIAWAILFGAGFIPGIGEGMDAYEFYTALLAGNTVKAVAALAGMLPVAGNIADLRKLRPQQLLPMPSTPRGLLPSPPTIDQRTGWPVGRFINDGKGNTMIEPKGGQTIPAGRNGVDTHTTYPNRSNYQRYNPQGHANNPTPHGHGHAEGSGPGRKGQGPPLDIHGNKVPSNSPDAHWPLN